MPTRATSFVTLTIISALALLISSLWAAPELRDGGTYLVFCCFAIAAAMLKVRLPGLTGTISLSFVFVLVAVAWFTFTETILIGCQVGLVQCLWRPKHRPRLVQVLFNVGALAISSAMSYRVAHAIVPFGRDHTIVMLTVAASMYFAMNTLLVSGVISLVESKSVINTWRRCYLWSFPYYVMGAGIAGTAASAREMGGWLTAAGVLFSGYLLYLFYQILIGRVSAT